MWNALKIQTLNINADKTLDINDIIAYNETKVVSLPVVKEEILIAA